MGGMFLHIKMTDFSHIFKQNISMWDVSKVTDVNLEDVNHSFGFIDDNFSPFKK
ncbi:MAG: hypothetical protein L3J43_07555 [Sulfurovum sp.]|nr:hypothetical protein [Sulfurovum sp.]